MAAVTSIATERDRLLQRLRELAKPGAEPYDEEALLSTGEVALLFFVSPATVRTWADAGKLPSVRTLGGHRRFIASAIWTRFLGSVAPAGQLDTVAG